MGEPEQIPQQDTRKGKPSSDETPTGKAKLQPPITKSAKIIDLARQERITLAEIAIAAGTTPGTVSTLLSKARQTDPTIPLLITAEEKQEPLARFRKAEHDEALDRQQEAIALEAEGFDRDEIALIMSVSPRAVRRYLQPPGPSGKTIAEREEQWRAVWRLHDNGMTDAEIGRAVRMGRSGVGKILRRPRPPEPENESTPTEQ